tara:strand:+ start:919 stop:1617 length:699 start_codon:yes stop_codon:yes gene_type:complete
LIDGKKILAVIPARGGSKGIKNKNITELAGRPLLQWTIEAAKKSKYIDRFVLSSDDPQIQMVAESLGCEVPFTRAAHLATDEASTIDVLFDVLERVAGFDVVILLQPTSPFRIAEDIDSCLESMISNAAPAAVSLCAVQDHPALVFKFQNDKKITPFLSRPPSQSLRRQDLPAAFKLNGAVYIANIPWLFKNRTFTATESVGYVMPESRSIDIDDAQDLSLAQQLAQGPLSD